MKRYEIVATAWKEEDSDGEFVRFKDAQAEIDRLNKACDQRAAHEYKLMCEIDALKAQNAELLAAQEGTPCKHKFHVDAGGVLFCVYCSVSFSEQQQAIAKARGDL